MPDLPGDLIHTANYSATRWTTALSPTVPNGEFSKLSLIQIIVDCGNDRKTAKAQKNCPQRKKKSLHKSFFKKSATTAYTIYMY